MKYILSIFLFVISIQLDAQINNKSGIIYGKNHAFSLTAPQGWVLDNRAGVSQGIHAVFYREGTSWAEAETVMYANTASLEIPAHTTLDELITFDIENFTSHYADLKIEDAPSILIEEDNYARIKYLSGDSYGNYEAIAYIDAGKTGVMLIVSSRTNEGFNASLDAFHDLINSYFFIAEEIEFE